MRRRRRGVLDAESLGYRHCPPPSDWTVDTLRQHFETRLAELDRRVEQRFDAMDRALSLAHRELDRWRDSSNEWRSAMTDRERTFMPRSESEQQSALMWARIEELAKRSSEAEGRQRGIPWLLAGAGTLIAVATLIIALIGARGG